MDADGNSFMVFPDLPNEIYYTADVSSFISKNLQFTLPGRQLGSSTLGSLLSHEIGHTRIGGMLGEVRATSIFENQYAGVTIYRW